ncbi:37380_t:CDS:1, partial [Gigaspora margarita]
IKLDGNVTNTYSENTIQKRLTLLEDLERMKIDDEPDYHKSNVNSWQTGSTKNIYV